jgi:hypothetical protein
MSKIEKFALYFAGGIVAANTMHANEWRSPFNQVVAFKMPHIREQN